MVRPDETLPERLASKFTTGSGCWEWTAAIRPDGYGSVWDATLRRPNLAHRVIYGLLVGPIPTGHTIDHLCKNHACVRPDHLEAVTQRENVIRGNGWSGRHARKTHCPHGHEYSPENTYYDRGARCCRECSRAKNHRSYQKRRLA